ncbi:hypothetical protein V496_01573 [Pseudogymnoascus sp. VKM F-4515 (FW-2607)]|nr:hypothetical protein V496_01573 [Pseudogymnoascus sp. VKM F-4515 (FW-2607)]
MSTTGNGSVTSKSSKQKFSAQLKELLVSAKKVLGNEKDIDTLDRILDDKKELEAKLSLKTLEGLEKDKEIANKSLEVEKLQRAKKMLHEEFQEQFKSWDTGTSRQKELEAETSELHGKLGGAARRADSAKSKIAELQQVILNCQNDLGEVKDELNRTSKDLRSKERELSGALSELESLQEEEKALGLQVLDHHELSARFGGFIQSFHKLAKVFFFTQFPDSMTYDDLQGRLYQSGFMKLAPKSIPISNSLPSQFLRMAAAEKIVAQKLCTNIFRQYYLPETLADRQAMDSVLERLLQANSRDEAIFRLRLLSAYKSEENTHVTSVVKSTIQEVVTVLGPLISPDLQGDFQSKLGKLLQEAVKLWSPVQRSAVRAYVDNEPEHGWDSFKDYDGLMDSTSDQMKQAQIPQNPIDSLFPRISIGDNIICQGYALWSSQNMVVAAGLEYSLAKSPILAHGRLSSSRAAVARQGSDRRRLSSSTSSAIGDGWTDTPAPPVAQRGHHSFSDHVTSRKTLGIQHVGVVKLLISFSAELREVDEDVIFILCGNVAPCHSSLAPMTASASTLCGLSSTIAMSLSTEATRCTGSRAASAYTGHIRTKSTFFVRIVPGLHRPSRGRLVRAGIKLFGNIMISMVVGGQIMNGEQNRSNQRLIPCCGLGSLTGWNFEYFDEPGENGYECSAAGPCDSYCGGNG